MTEILGVTTFELNKTWSFGPHALLSQDDLVFISRMLECKHCRLRRVYHSLAARELSGLSNNLIWLSIRPRRHFHQFSRLIRAIIIATKRQRTLYRSGGSLCSFMPPLQGLLPLRPPRSRRWICSDHATDAFRYMFYAADDAIDHLHVSGVLASKSAKWVRVIFPKGHSEFYRKGLSKFEKASSVPTFRTSHTVPSCLSENDKFVPPSCGLMLILGTKDFAGTAGSGFLSNTFIEDANRRWNEGYKDVTFTNRVERCGKMVRFPKYSPVTRVHHLITYETARRLLREDRTWEFCCMDRMREGLSVENECEESDENSISSILMKDCSIQDLDGGDGQPFDQIQIGSHSVSVENHIDLDMAETNRKKRRKKRRRRFNKRDTVPPLEKPDNCIDSDLVRKGSSSPFHLDSSYLDKISSLLLDKLCSSSHEPRSTTRIMDEFCVSEVSQNS